MIVGQFINRYLSQMSGSNLKAAYLCKHLSDLCKVVVYSKDLNPILQGRVKYFRIGKVFLPPQWPLFYCNYSNRFKIPNKIIRYMQTYSILDKGNYDILHCHTILSSAMIANIYSEKISKPLVLDVHGLIDATETSKCRCFRRLVQKFTAVFVPTTDWGDYLIKKFKVNQGIVFTVPDGVDINTLDQNYSFHESELIKKKLNLKEKFVLMFVGNFANLDPFELLNIFKKLNEKIPNSKNKIAFIVITQAKLKESNMVSSFIKNHNLTNLIWHNPVPYENLFNYLKISNINLGIMGKNDFTNRVPISKIFSYLASGVPTIVPDLVSNRKIVDNYKNGLLAKPGDTDDFVSKIIELMNDENLRKEIGKNGRETVVKKHTWKKSAEKAYKAYKQILGES